MAIASGKRTGTPYASCSSSCNWNRRFLVATSLILCFLSGLLLLYYRTTTVLLNSCSTTEIAAPSVLTSTLHLPTWYRKHDWGLVENASLRNLVVKNRALDNEEQTAWDNFFFGTTSGLILEIGAMDGNQFSLSYFFEYYANWRAILVEGNPILASHIVRNRPNALSFNAVICNKPREVHYIVDSHGQDGILEFMTDTFMAIFFKQLITNGKVDPIKVEANMKSRAPIIKNVQCYPLTHILDTFDIKRINFFMLDLEGGELNALKAIDFNRTSFDVIAVETNRGTDTPEVTAEYTDSVIQLLLSKGYLLWARQLGRNSWFYSPDFQPFNKSRMN